MHYISVSLPQHGPRAFSRAGDLKTQNVSFNFLRAFASFLISLPIPIENDCEPLHATTSTHYLPQRSKMPRYASVNGSFPAVSLSLFYQSGFRSISIPFRSPFSAVSPMFATKSSCCRLFQALQDNRSINPDFCE